MDNLHELVKLANEGKTTRELSLVSGIPKTTLLRAFRRAGYVYSKEARQWRSILHDKQLIDDIANKICDAQIQQASAHKTTLLRALQQANPALNKSETVKLPKKAENSLLIHISDWHFGEIVTKDETASLNEYNPHIAVQRLTELAEFLEQNHSHKKYNTVYIILNGDTIAGSLHADSVSYSTGAAEQVCEAATHLQNFANRIHASIPANQYKIIATVGNHSRTTKFMPTGHKRITTNWELAMIKILETGLTAWNVESPKDDIVFETIEGHGYAFLHGDVIRGGGGNTPSLTKKLADHAEFLRTIHPSITNVRYGHFHTHAAYTTMRTHVILCPSSKGTDSYSMKIKAPNNPMFLIETVHRQGQPTTQLFTPNA